ncbi:hypothetical protein A3B45_03345 [Candidatus Daviesbacteria bacterium RIFCSPLOWO2_01_FULL_39_12]|uniref:Uncharacterized protein n=1 Tax=Candidatus Daviesbacteria bacterium RIFCSPLOWO2_01_FULL_39_12 TaxID=1797785 RepID=A0A1F5KRY2_9BACT|nr:MAG: hypothetical protein A3D79_03370 [Candidatus Daviesbacteria bacterium RIFCSPHIGHO2_02_FULL_39_8]OGE43697.1 MAG: hypothetical protein A3B45_03345 [Candidatus Daviesbacteria bacterium RIFCSPLOWO2_01_FULL_39_12]
MGERRIETLEEQLFPPIFGEDGYFPPAPDPAVLEYRRLQRKWLETFPRSEGIEPTVSLYPQKRNGRTMYIVAKEVIISE